MASILNLQRNGAVGFIGWLGPWVSPIGLSYLPQCERKQRQTKRKYEYSYDRLYALKKSILEQRHKLLEQLPIRRACSQILVGASAAWLEHLLRSSFPRATRRRM